MDKTFYIFNPFNWKLWLYGIASCVLFTFTYCLVEWKTSETKGIPCAVAFWYCVQRCLSQSENIHSPFKRLIFELHEPLRFVFFKTCFLVIICSWKRFSKEHYITNNGKFADVVLVSYFRYLLPKFNRTNDR